MPRFERPILDGSQILRILAETLARRRFGEKFEQIFTWTGVAMLLGIAIFCTANDVMQLLC